MSASGDELSSGGVLPSGEEAESRQAVGSRLTALQIRMETNHAQTTRLLTLVSGLSSQVASALADASASADGIGGRMQSLTRDAEAMLARLLDATQITQEAIGDVALHVDRLGAATGEYSRRLRTDVEQYEVSTVQAITGLETAAAAVGTGLVDDIAEVLMALRMAVTDTGADLAGIADSGQVRIQRMLERLDERITTHTRGMSTATAQLSTAVAELAESRTSAATASDQMAETAANLHLMSVDALNRMAVSTDGLEERVGEMLDAALTEGSAQTAREVQSLSTTLAWATRSVQQVVETLTDDLRATTTASLRRIDTAGREASSRLEAVLAEAEGTMSEEVGSSIQPLREETARVAEQQADLARSISDTEALLRKRNADVEAQADTAARLEQVTREMVDVIARHAEDVRDEQEAAAARAEAISAMLADGADRAEAVIARLQTVTEQLVDTADAADRSRQDLQQVLTRAEELAAAAAAKRRTAAVVPPPS